MAKNPEDAPADPEAAQVALREGIERANELICEAKQLIGKGKDDPPAPVPPNPAS